MTLNRSSCGLPGSVGNRRAQRAEPQKDHYKRPCPQLVNSLNRVLGSRVAHWLSLVAVFLSAMQFAEVNGLVAFLHLAAQGRCVRG